MYAGFFIFIYEGGDYMREIFENVLPYYLGQWPDIESDSGDGNE